MNRSFILSSLIVILMSFPVTGTDDIATHAGKNISLVSKQSGKVLDVRGGKKDDGSSVIQYKFVGSANQLFTLVASVEKDYYYIINGNSGKNVDINKALQLVINTGSAAASQKWKFVPQKDGYVIVSKGNGMAVTPGVEDGKNSGRPFLAAKSGEVSQLWQIKEKAEEKKLDIARIIETANEFGGKTVEITSVDQVKQQWTRVEVYAIDSGDGFEFIAGDSNSKGRVFDKIIYYYNASDAIAKDDVYYNPQCEFFNKFGVAREINDYVMVEGNKRLFSVKKKVFFNEKAIKETGKVLGEYLYRLFHSDQPLKEINNDYWYEATEFDHWSRSDDIIIYTVTYSDEWRNKNGYDKTVHVPWDGLRTHKDYIFTGEHAKKSGCFLKRTYYDKTSKNGTVIYTITGEEKHRTGNEYGGITTEAIYNENDIFYKTRGVEKQTYFYDASKVLRQAVLEGKTIKDLQIKSFMGLFSDSIYKIIDRYDEKGFPLSEEVFPYEEKNYCNAKSMKFTYNRDFSVTLEHVYSDKYLKWKEGLTQEKLVKKLFNKNRLVTEQTYLVIGPEIVTVKTSQDLSAISYAFTGQNPWEIAAHLKKYTITTRVDEYKDDKKIKSSKNTEIVEVNPLDYIWFAADTMPITSRLSDSKAVAYIKKYAFTDMEKAYGAFWLASHNIAWGHRKYQCPIILEQTGVCGNQSQFYLAIAKRLGLETSYVFGKLGKSDHAWNVVSIDGKYCPLDVTLDEFIAEPRGYLRTHWPRNPELQCVTPPYKSIDDYAMKTGLGKDYFKMNEKADHTDIEEFHRTEQVPVEVKYQGKWVPATIQEQKGIKYRIKYDGPDASKEEWVTKERFKHWSLDDYFN